MNPASTEASRSFAIDFRRSWVQSQLPVLAVHVWVNWLRERETNMIFLRIWAKNSSEILKNFGKLPQPHYSIHAAIFVYPHALQERLSFLRFSISHFIVWLIK